MEWQLISSVSRNAGRKPVKGDPFYYSRGKEGDQQLVLRITIPQDMMQKMRWVVGDKVTVLRDDSARLGLIKRIVADGEPGWTLSAQGQNKAKAKLIGSTKRTCVQIKLSSTDMQQIFANGERQRVPDNVEITNEGILFDLPRK